MSNVYQMYGRSGANFEQREEVISESNSQLVIKVDPIRSGEEALARLALAPDNLKLIDAHQDFKILEELRHSGRDGLSKSNRDRLPLALPGFWPNLPEGICGLFPLGIEEAGEAWLRLCWQKLIGVEFPEPNQEAVFTFEKMEPNAEEGRTLYFWVQHGTNAGRASIRLLRNSSNEWVPGRGWAIAFYTTKRVPVAGFRWHLNRMFEMRRH